jgi:methionine-rich copper-binding protein CopC
MILGGLAPREAGAHAGLRFSNPAAGAALGDTPKVVQITFWEKPEATLSEIRVLDTAGTARQLDRPTPVPDAPTALAVHVRPLEKGVYTVTWRTISSVDGHATVGAFAFGVGVKPSGVVGSGMAPAYPPPTPREMTARAVFIAGLVLLLGAAAATVLRFGGSSDLRLGAAGWAAALAGLLLLAAAQRRNAGASYVALAHTAIGRSLLGRAVALLAAGAALVAAARSAETAHRIRLMTGVALATLAAMAVHTAAGHAAAAGPLAVAIPAAIAHWTHFAAVGVWMARRPGTGGRSQ